MQHIINSDIPASLENFDRLPAAAIIRLPTLVAVLGVSTGTVWRLSRAGKLKPVKLSMRATGWRVGDVRTYLAELSSDQQAA